jgi:hypothetical protein
MPIPVTDLISTTAESDTYATHTSILGKGGLHEVANIEARDAITVERRRAGMLVFTQDTQQYYTLSNDLISWTPFSGVETIQLEAGVTMSAGTPVYISANKLYPADNLVNTRVVGILAADVTATFMGVIVTSGKVSISDLIQGNEYFLGDQVIQSYAPSSGTIVKIGDAISSTVLAVNIHLSILLV